MLVAALSQVTTTRHHHKALPQEIVYEGSCPYMKTFTAEATDSTRQDCRQPTRRGLVTPATPCTNESLLTISGPHQRNA
ncbi:hypothetical protein E2C01_039840 [Portunus trituberculatus]|uniref:Uncharacterized protein n=1 Tax=Portunus trituberculatus TaxID=210409 RepID=A0A5B7FFT4_PORTR|nr:hypothetical protein [Portunus trituberculatus]